MEFERPLLVAGFGACTSVGLSAAESCNAVLSGVSRIARQKRYPSSRRGEAAALAQQDCLSEDASCVSRMTELARRALTEALRHSAGVVGEAAMPSTGPTPVLLSLPPERPGLSKAEMAAVALEICESVPRFDRRASRLFDNGHTGFIAAMAKAADILQKNEADFCVVGAADSPLDLNYLHWLDAADRLKHRDNPFGVVPGEGAAFTILTRDASYPGEPGPPRIVLRAVGLGTEPMPWYLEQATRGEGLTRAIAACLPAGVQVDNCYADLTGETWRSAEWDFAFLRNGRSFAHPLDICHPADIWGDTGVASSALLCMLAHAELLDDIVPRRYSLIVSASDTRPSRAACLLERINHQSALS